MARYRATVLLAEEALFYTLTNRVRSCERREIRDRRGLPVDRRIAEGALFYTLTNKVRSCERREIRDRRGLFYTLTNRVRSCERREIGEVYRWIEG